MSFIHVARVEKEALTGQQSAVYFGYKSFFYKHVNEKQFTQTV